MLFYDEKEKNPLTDKQLRFLIESKAIPDITTWEIVCRYIMKMRLSDWHFKAMNETLQHGCTLTMAPRGIGKSYLLTTSYVLFKILKYRNIRIGVVSANYTSAQAFSMELKQYFEKDMSPIWDIFGDIRGDKWSGSKFSLKRDKIYKEQTVSCFSMQSTNAMGTHMDEWIFDDIVSELNSDTEQKRNKLKNRFHSVFEKAIVQTGPKIFRFIGTPWHPNDFYVYLRQNPVMAKKYHQIILPAIILNKKTGEQRSIDPVQLKWEDLMEAKAIDTRSWKMQYLMQTFNDGGTLFKSKDIQYYRDSGVENGKAYVTKIISEEYRDEKESFKECKVKKIFIKSVWIGCDLASAGKDKSDDMVIAVVGIDDLNNIYLLDIYVGKPQASNILKVINKMYLKWNMAKRVGIESNAFQKFLYDLVNENYNIPTKKIVTSKSKYDRFYQFSAEFEKGKVFIKQPYSNLDEEYKKQYNSHYYKLEEQLLNFVDGKDGTHDDTIDAFCMGWELYVSSTVSEIESGTVENISPGTFSGLW
ncbi:hypothetical protein B5E87_00235 [Massilimicrobiota sp. An142]|uniref:phage terminase large subunit family protein n=1 Tax=Massilimicrobiota sp. An142 TaxID=1965564 RepID=UPI000B39CF42|nr:hypothetical protein [Massilimicrobiota sp. An142]OUQ15034.1 hypothetical protein B5E87_00235 [Massilimicrobiota sp. An142]